MKNVLELTSRPNRLTASDLQDHDALVVVASSPGAASAEAIGAPAASAIEAALRTDAAIGKAPHPPIVLPAKGAPGDRVVVASLPALTLDTDDVRAVAEVTIAAVARAVAAGAKKPLLWMGAPPDAPRFARAVEVGALAALGSQWMPLEAREAEKAPATAQTIGVAGLSEAAARRVRAVERGRVLCRDITGTEPERMAPRRVAALCEEAFQGTSVAVEVEHDVASYPLLSAVARASLVVERHKPCVVKLEHKPKGAIRRTVILVGKGVTYDTGGADLKTNGHMAGMSRDKGGAGAVAGFLRTAAELATPGVHVIGLLGMVRNSVGEEAFVSDEIIRARSGARVRIGNTDAEGRLVLADLLSRAKDLAAGAPSPILISLATLTGHVYRAWGPYIGALGNPVARAAGEMQTLDACGELWGEPVEASRPRREDYAMVAARSSAEDVVSSNRLASVDTPRGHQYPFAFIDIASGLRGGPLPWVHMDIGGVAVDPPDWQFGKPTGSPIATLVSWLLEP